MIDATKLLAMDKTVILYRPQFNSFTGSPLATLLLSQLAYWWDKSGAKPFYKFKEPCNHKMYKRGDSWCEELGFTRRLFDSALRFLEEAGIVSHKTDQSRLTWYSVDTEALTAKITDMLTDENDSVKAENAFSVKRKNAFSVKCKNAFTTTETTETTQENASPESQDNSLENLQAEKQPEKQNEEHMKIQSGNTELLEQIKANMPKKRSGGGNVNSLVILWKQLRSEWLPSYQGNLTGKETGFLKLLLKDFGGEAENMLSYAVSKWSIFAEKACQATGSSDRPTQPQLGFIAQNRSTLGELYLTSKKQASPTPVQTAPTQSVSDDVDLFEALK